MKRRLILLFALVPTLLLAAFNESGRLRDLTVTGDLRVGGSLELTDITASGTVTADSIKVMGNIDAGVIITEDDTSISSYIKTYDGIAYIYDEYYYGDVKKMNVGWSSSRAGINTFGGVDLTFAVSGFNVYIDNLGQMVVGEDEFISDGQMLTVIEGGQFGTIVKIGGLVTKDTVVTLADDAFWNAPTGVSGFGEIMIGNNQEWAQIRFTSAGVVTLVQNSTNVAAADTDGNLAIYQNAGTDGIIIKNRLGSSLKCGITIKYYTP